MYIDQELDRLYGLPPEEFTAARNELAREFAKRGDQGADEVRRLAKPTLAVWAINQLARREPLALRRLLAAGAALRKAQERALEGGATAGLQKAQREQRDALRILADRARALFAESGRSVSEAMLERVTATLAAASVDESARASLKAGRVAAELEPAGFDALAGMRLPARGTAQPAPRRTEQRRKRLRELREQARRLEREARDAEHAADVAEAEAAKLRRAAQSARTAADRAAARLDEQA